MLFFFNLLSCEFLLFFLTCCCVLELATLELSQKAHVPIMCEFITCAMSNGNVLYVHVNFSNVEWFPPVVKMHISQVYFIWVETYIYTHTWLISQMDSQLGETSSRAGNQGVWCGKVVNDNSPDNLHKHSGLIFNYVRQLFLTYFCHQFKKIHTHNFTSHTKAANADFRFNILSMQMSSHIQVVLFFFERKYISQTKSASSKLTPFNLQIFLG